ncbi:MAG: Rieske (2Fe-2S) protein [Nitrospinaceae bacterium]
MKKEDLYVPAAKTGDIPRDSRKRVEIEGQRISIFNIAHQYYAILDTCPHKKTAPLIRGTLDGLGIKCPNHGYRFDLKTGDCNVDPNLKTRVFPVKVVGDDIFIRLK